MSRPISLKSDAELLVERRLGEVRALERSNADERIRLEERREQLQNRRFELEEVLAELVAAPAEDDEA